jgi:hypothetical protein
VLLAAGTLLPAAQPGASIFVGTNAVRPTLGIDARGTAVVTWIVGGSRQAVTVPARGQPFHGGSPSGDVSRPAGKDGLANALVVRRTPDGRSGRCRPGRRRPGWKRMLGVAPTADGSFSAFVRPEWKGKRYRATVLGPNIGTTFVPDAQATIAA